MQLLRYHFSVSAYFARLAIQRQLEYPLFLVSWLLMIPTQYFTGVWMLDIIVGKFQPLNGWGFPELAFLYGLGLLSHGVMVVLFIQTWHMDHMVIHGGFDRMLLRPMNVFFQFVVQNVNFIGLIDLIPGTVIFLYGCHLVGFAWTWLNVLKLLLVIAGGTFIRAAFYMAMGSIAFWTKRSGSLVDLGLTLLQQTTMYPMTLYPYLVQALLTFLIPLGFISFYPAVDFLGKNGEFSLPAGLALWTPVVGALSFGVGYLVFSLGMRNYESSGS
jgi:ABC-2 type transport system permease protein